MPIFGNALQDVPRKLTNLVLSSLVHVDKCTKILEKQLNQRIRHFWLEATETLLILQCDCAVDGDRILQCVLHLLFQICCWPNS